MANERELTVDELDVEDMVMNMHFRIGAAYVMTTQGNGERYRELEGKLWQLIPFIKALGELAVENPGRTRALWAAALQSPMLFGGPAIGMPRVANVSLEHPAVKALREAREFAEKERDDG
jgi:hypothetical protein